MKRREFFQRGLAAATVGGAPAASVLSTAAVEPTGSDEANRAFFRVEQRGAKWFVVGPDGRPTCLRGANHFGDGTYSRSRKSLSTSSIQPSCVSHMVPPQSSAAGPSRHRRGPCGKTSV
jgi:hypothetical protein